MVSFGALDKVSEVLVAIDIAIATDIICSHILCIILMSRIREELLRRYPDVMVGMGSSKELGQVGPDDAGDKLKKTTIKVSRYHHIITSIRFLFLQTTAIFSMLQDFIINHMHDPDTEKYVFGKCIVHLSLDLVLIKRYRC